jgi:hypothetical protein
LFEFFLAFRLLLLEVLVLAQRNRFPEKLEEIVGTIVGNKNNIASTLKKMYPLKT